MKNFVLDEDILHEAQIGFFLPNHRTSDHIFTLRTLIDKYVTEQDPKGKLCTFYFDFKKAFDSVWRDDLFYIMTYIYITCIIVAL